MSTAVETYRATRDAMTRGEAYALAQLIVWGTDDDATRLEAAADIVKRGERSREYASGARASDRYGSLTVDIPRGDDGPHRTRAHALELARSVWGERAALSGPHMGEHGGRHPYNGERITLRRFSVVILETRPASDIIRARADLA